MTTASPRRRLRSTLLLALGAFVLLAVGFAAGNYFPIRGDKDSQSKTNKPDKDAVLAVACPRFVVQSV